MKDINTKFNNRYKNNKLTQYGEVIKNQNNKSHVEEIKLTPVKKGGKQIKKVVFSAEKENEINKKNEKIDQIMNINNSEMKTAT